MSSDDIVLSVKNVSKCFEMYDKPRHRLQQMLLGPFGKKYYREFWALRDINLDVCRGECIGLIGSNGAGKSTLLQIITGTLQPTSGEVAVHGRIAALLELGSGFNPEFTGRENVYMNAAILGLTKKETDNKFQEIAEFADIGEFIDQPVKTYSSGMMVRLAFAVQIMVEPDILIVDEALSVGDAYFQQKCMRFMRKFIETHTVLFVSHDIVAVTAFCNKCVLLEHGKIKATGNPKEVTEKYLEDLYSKHQDTVTSRVVQKVNNHPNLPSKILYDMRRDIINQSKFRNDIQVFNFSRDNLFGSGGAQILSVAFLDSSEKPLSWVVGGEIVILKIVCEAQKNLYNPIVGFTVKDRMGQALFAENTFIAYQEKFIEIKRDTVFSAEFTFQMPVLVQGDYCISAAIAEGTQEVHTQLEVVNEALTFRSLSSYTHAIFGVNLLKIGLIQDGRVL